jgi:putative peptide zinc metalloprotease protein
MMTAPIQGGGGAAALLPLREELGLFPGPTALDGSPTWTLHDPVRNRFYRLGWREFEVLSRWGSGSIEALTERVDVETTLRVDRDDVEELARFLFAFDLLRATNEQATDHMVKKLQQQRRSWGTWLLHNYLFMRIPLLRPDRLLTAAYPYVSWIFSRRIALAIAALGVIGLYLIARQWDSFLETFVDLLTLEGAAAFGITLFILKIVHELGHALTAKRFGCRIPTMGLAILVLMPVLYTDVNEAWTLRKRGQRLAIGLAGVTAELCCAAIAAFAWGFLPNGPARSVAFLVATSTWLTTVMLNLSPFMRYDGYYVLSDWLEMPNLHIRAFALAQWWLREKLLGLTDPPPEELPDGRRHFLILFAFLTWAYRFSLFIGIAVIVYHFVIKIVGLGMMVVEIGYFVVWPVVHELRIWWKRRADISLSPRTVITALALAALVLILVVPWRSAIEAPALLKSQQHVDVFAPEFGVRVAAVGVRDGEQIGRGAPLVTLASPDLDYKLARTRSELEVLEWQMAAKGLDSTLLARSQVTEREYETTLAEYRGLTDQKSRLEIAAPIAGMVVDIADGLEAGSWLPAKTRLLSVVDPSGVTVEAYVEEADLARIAPGDAATFVAEADNRVEVPLRVANVAGGSTRLLTERALASTFGGPIPVRTQKQGELIPDQTIYRVTLTVAGSLSFQSRMIRGRVILHGKTISLAAAAWRAILAVAIRESGA